MLQDPVDADAVELDMTNPEFKKLAFTAPGPKNSFAPVKQDNYRRVSKQREPQCSECVRVKRVKCAGEGGGFFIFLPYIPKRTCILLSAFVCC